MGVKFVFYSHSDYKDAWPILFGQCNKYLNEFKKVLFTDTGTAPPDWEVITYDNKLNYKDRVISCLKKLDSDIIVFHHEDMILYDFPKIKILYEFFEIVSKNSVFIKLLCAGYTDQKIKTEVHSNLLTCPVEMVFTIQPTVCKKNDLLIMYEQTQGKDIWSFESNTWKTTVNNNFIGYMAFTDSDKKRGMHHYDSIIYPYIATAIVKGKWNISDYFVELKSLLAEYDIDPKIRGII